MTVTDSMYTDNSSVFNLPTHRVNRIDTDGGLNWHDPPFIGNDHPGGAPSVVLLVWTVSVLTTYGHMHGLCLN